jgi:prevent-host-death family protein
MVTSTDAREQWDELLDRVHAHEARFLVERDGKPVAAVISARDLAFFGRLVQRWHKDFEIVHEIQQRFAHIPDDEIEREIEKALAEVRAENRQRVTDPASVPAS